MSLVYPQKVTLYQVGDDVMGASFNNFLDAIDGSYCTYMGGDDPTQDGIYPDTINDPGAYKGPENCGGFAATNVISTSYGRFDFFVPFNTPITNVLPGYNEADLTPFYEKRQCNGKHKHVLHIAAVAPKYMLILLLRIHEAWSSRCYCSVLIRRLWCRW